MKGFFLGVIAVGIVASVLYILHHNKDDIGWSNLKDERVRYRWVVVGLIILGCVVICIFGGG